MDECICHPPVYNMSCPAHAWYFEEMRRLPIVCDNRLADLMNPKKEKLTKVPNRKDKRRGKSNY